MNLSLDGYIAAPGDDLGWSGPSDELFRWWSDQVPATGLALYGRKLWETMSSYWPTADQQPGATPAQIEFARRWRDLPKVVFSSTTSAVDWNARLVGGGTPFFPALDNWVNLNLVETRTFPDGVLLTRYETRR
jgi:dihydrofolate reductase